MSPMAFHDHATGHRQRCASCDPVTPTTPVLQKISSLSPHIKLIRRKRKHLRGFFHVEVLNHRQEFRATGDSTSPRRPRCINKSTHSAAVKVHIAQQGKPHEMQTRQTRNAARGVKSEVHHTRRGTWRTGVGPHELESRQDIAAKGRTLELH